jgi:hypothetical protein
MLSMALAQGYMADVHVQSIVEMDKDGRGDVGG